MNPALGIDPTAVHTTKQFQLGQVASDHKGRFFTYIEADATIAAGDVLIIHNDGGAAGITTTLSAPDTGQGKPVGVAMAALSTGEFGWACRFNQLSEADVQAKVLTLAKDNTALNTTATAGALDDDATAGAEVVEGLVVTTTAGGGTELENAILTWPYVGRTL